MTELWPIVFSRRGILVLWLGLSAVAVTMGLTWVEPGDWSIVLNTGFLGLVTALIAVPVGGWVTWLISSSGLTARLLLLTCAGLFVVPPLMHVAAWDSALGKLGWWTSSSGQPLQPILTGWSAAILVHVLAAVPQVALIFLVGRMVIGRALEDQAELDSGSWGVFVHVTLPRMAPLVLFAAVWVFVGCSREIAATDLYQIGTLAEQIYLGFSLGQLRSIGASWSNEQLEVARTMGPAAGILLVFWISGTAILVITNLTVSPSESSGHRPFRLPLGRPTGLRTLGQVVVLVLMAGIPALSLLFRASFLVTEKNGHPVPGYSVTEALSSMSRAATNFQEGFFWSMVIAALSASFILLSSLTLTWLARENRCFRALFVMLVSVCCALPGPLIGLWLAGLFTVSDVNWLAWLYDQTILAPVLANLIFCFPAGALISWFIVSSSARDMNEHAHLEGAGSLTRVIRLNLAANRLAVFGTWLLLFAICYGELSASQMVLPPGIDTIPRITLGLLHSGVDEMTAALTIVSIVSLVTVSAAGWTAIWLNLRRRDRQ